MRSKTLDGGAPADILRQYDKYLEDYDRYIAQHSADNPKIAGLSRYLTTVGVLVANILTGIKTDADPGKTLSIAISTRRMFNEWLEGGLQASSEDLSGDMMALGAVFYSDAGHLQLRNMLKYALSLICHVYRKDEVVVLQAAAYYDKALEAMLEDYQKKVKEIEESRRVKGESDEKVSAELGGYGKGAQEKKSDKVEDGVKVERKDDGKWQERVRSGSPGKEREELGKGSR